MVDAFDRANTLSFTVIAELTGELTASAIEDALRKLETRHPLLCAQVIRDGHDIVLSRGEGAHIPLTVEHGDAARLLDLAAKSIEHRVWLDGGPRAELTWLRFDDRRSALLLCLHHLVSDGSSGMIAMRDLLSFIVAPDTVTEPLDSPGLHAFLPAQDTGLAAYGRALALIAKTVTGAKPQRLRAALCPPSQRRAQLAPIDLTEVQTARLVARARRDGATAHGVLCAALGLAVAAENDGTMQQRITHPVDLRRYLRSRDPQAAHAGAIGDRVGYYVSSVDTDHAVTPSTTLATLTRDVTASIRRKKQLGVPLLTAPIAGPLVVRATRNMTPERFCRLAERDLMLSTFSVTNLGRLESLGLHPAVGALRVDNVWFAAAGSVLAALGASATTFQERLRMVISGAEPLIAPAVFARITQRVSDQLTQYAVDH